MSINMNSVRDLAGIGISLIIRECSDVNSLKEIIQISVKNKQTITISSRCFSDYDVKDIAKIGGEYLTVIVE